MQTSTTITRPKNTVLSQAWDWLWRRLLAPDVSKEQRSVTETSPSIFHHAPGQVKRLT